RPQQFMSKAARISLHVYLTLTLFGMTVAVLYIWLMRNDFLAQNPDLEPYYSQYIAAVMLSGVGALGLLKGRFWGFWALILGMTGAFGIEIMTGFPFDRIIRIPAAALILLLLMRWNKKI
ncbi:MAG: hypothetical protein Q7U74_11110, partial [Saprospiraceae bacterium]|nr:hypothetical protein [Saprospiraceae bacterium]